MPYPYTYARMAVPAGTRQILVLIENPDFNANADLYYKVDTSFGNYNINNTPTSYGFTAISSNNLISVQNSNYVTFSVVGKDVVPVTSKVTVVSMPDFTQLGSFTVNVQTIAGVDPTPTPTPNWANVANNYLSGVWEITSNYLTGFNVNPITLSVTITNISGVTPELWYYVGSTDPTSFFNSTVDPGTNGFTRILTGQTFTVAPNNYVAFVPNTGTASNGQATVLVKNVTDANTTLDSFTITTINL